MTTWHRFNQHEEDNPNREMDWEFLHWTDVMPGDVVQSRGTCAYKMRDFETRPIQELLKDDNAKVLRLHSAPVLVLSRHEGIPGEDYPGRVRTFVCLSRHGLLVVLQAVRDDADQT